MEEMKYSLAIRKRKEKIGNISEETITKREHTGM